MLLSGPSFLSA